MHHEGSIRIPSRRHGLFAFLRQKQWWSFEGLDEARGLYFVLLALEGLPSSYVSLQAVDYRHNRRWEEDHLGSFRAAPGDQVDVAAQGKWGQVRFQGEGGSGWRVDVQTPNLRVVCEQRALAPAHFNRLLTRGIDYSIAQFPMNRCRGSLAIQGEACDFEGYGYHEHNWGVQPRHSRANWLHFWTPEAAGIVLDCHYDAGVAHHYTCVWHDGEWRYLYSPAQFFFSPDQVDRPWRIQSPDLILEASPLYYHHTRMMIPPLIGYVNVDYHELLVTVAGRAVVEGEMLPIRGIGKFDHNFNLW